ncbi:hypothetical protein YC2023_065996 [Brassica napus]
MVDSEDRYSTEKASSVQSMILYDCQSYSVIVKWRCRPELVQIHGFRSNEVLLDTPPGNPKNCPEARGGSVQVHISLSRPFSFFHGEAEVVSKTRSFQSSPVKASLGFWLSPLRSTSCFSPRTLVLGHIGRTTGTTGLCCRVECLCFLGLVPSGFKETPYSLDREDSDERCHVLWLSITRRCNVAVTRRTLGCRAVTRRTVGRGRLKGDRILPIERRNTKSPGPRLPLLEARSWQEAKSNLVTVALGKDDRIALCWTLGPPV